MKTKAIGFLTAILCTMVIASVAVSAQTKPLTDIEFWVQASVSEAGPPPDDWVAYKIIRDKLGINLKIVLVPSTLADQNTKINVAGAANALPDLFMVNRDVWYKLAKNGLLAQTNAMLPMMPIRNKTHYQSAIRNKLVTLNGKMYGFAEPGQLPMTDGLVIRKDWLDKLGLKVPKTTDELLAVAKAFTEKDPDGNGKADTYGFGAYIENSGLQQAGIGPRFDALFGAFGVAGMWNLENQSKFGLNVRNPDFLKALQYIKSFVDAKAIDPDWPTLKKDEFRARWKQGKYGIMTENFAALATVANYKDFDNNFPNGEWIAIAPPTGPKGLSSQGVVVENIRIIAASAKSVKAGKTEAMAKLLEWMASDEGYFLLGFGVDGVNYKRDAKGYVTTEGLPANQAWTSKEAQPLTQLRNLVFINTDIELAARYVAYKTKNGRTMDPLAYWNAFKQYQWTEATGSSLVNPPTNAADFMRYYGENMVKFVLGQTPLNDKTYADFLKGLDSIGAAKLEADAKEQLLEAGMLD